MPSSPWKNRCAAVAFTALSSLMGCGDDAPSHPNGPPSPQAKLRISHASPDPPAVDIDNDLPYRRASAPEGLKLPALQTVVGVTAATSANRAPVARFQLDTAPFVGRGVFAVAAGALSPNVGENEAGFRLVLVDTRTSPWSALGVHPMP
ncbi:hypothetical protein [Myxococcus stipitatus]|uniref:hypothetical protein n=1 Tax=Myxococcus stipitatus TaxID=83455 RepID=UPI0030D0AB0B